MKNLPFDQALSKAQTLVGSHEIYAIGESLDKSGEKIILVFASDTTNIYDIIPKVFYGHKVFLYHTGVIVPHESDQEE